jgi:hypothetical protein
MAAERQDYMLNLTEDEFVIVTVRERLAVKPVLKLVTE